MVHLLQLDWQGKSEDVETGDAADMRFRSAGLAVAAAVLWAAVNELLIQPVEYTCYNLALEKVRGQAPPSCAKLQRNVHPERDHGSIRSSRHLTLYNFIRGAGSADFRSTLLARIR